MPKKFTFEYVSNFIKENDVNHYCDLLSTEYVDIETPLLFKCNLCGKQFERPFKYVKLKRFRCPDCAQQAAANANRNSIQNIKDYLQEHDINNECTLLSTSYKDALTPLEFKCNLCGKEFKRPFYAVRRNKHYACTDCMEHAIPRTLRHSEEEVRKILKEKSGYTIIGKYTNASTPVKCRCSRGHEFNLVFAQYNRGHSGCAKCANINNSGENNHNWRGGITPIAEYFRSYLDSWKKECLKKANYTCDITGKSHNLVIHHLNNFSDIVYEAFKVLDIKIKTNISSYSLEEKERLINYIISKHTLDLGVVLDKEIHDLFHKIYGKTNNTREQYLIFKEDYLKGKYSDTQPS